MEMWKFNRGYILFNLSYNQSLTLILIFTAGEATG